MVRKVVILGGTGKMGRWLAVFLHKKGFDIAIYSRSPERAAKTAKELNIKYLDSLDNIHDADVVIVSTSLNSTSKVIREVSKKMKPNSILCDIASVKGDIIKALQEAGKNGIRTISIHPMFGPGVSSLQGKHLLVIPVRDDHELVDEISTLFQGAEIHIISSGEAHDAMMAMTLSLPHFLNLIFGQMLSKGDVREMVQFAGTTFALQLIVTEAVYSEDPNLYYEIQTQNSAFAEILDNFLKSARDSALIVKEKNREAFIRSFKEVKASLAKDPNFAAAYNRFCKAYEVTATNT